MKIFTSVLNCIMWVFLMVASLGVLLDYEVNKTIVISNYETYLGFFVFVMFASTLNIYLFIKGVFLNEQSNR